MSSASISRRSLLGAAACAAAAGAFAQSAQPLRIIVGVSAGSTSDILARLLADALSEVC
jgi:tripartite-type tricarboxylate transporter receptor subunit TctC